MALSKLYRPSLPSSLLDRMAPVTTIGIWSPIVVSKKKAVSSKVSVPWVITTPLISESMASMIRFFKISMCFGMICGEGRLKISSITRSTFSGTVISASNKGLTTSGLTPPVKMFSFIAMVPPVCKISIFFIFMDFLTNNFA